MDDPKVGIVITNYNYQKFIFKAINSALKQTHNCFVTLVDDGSTDNSVKNIKKVFQKSLTRVDTYTADYFNGLINNSIYNEFNFNLIEIKNSGASTARNIAIWNMWNEVDYFCILDADDFMMPDKVEVLLKYITEFPEIGVAYADYYLKKPDYTKLELKQPYDKKTLEKECIVHSGALISKKYLASIMLENKEFYDSRLHGPRSQGFIGCTEDYDLWLRLSKVCMMTHVPLPLTFVNELGHNQSLRMTPEIFQKNMEIIHGNNRN